MPLTRIQSLGITDGTIVAGDIASGAITAAKLAAGVGGKVLQVVTATDSTLRSTTSTSYVTASNTLSASITPSSASNKILILANTNLRGNVGVNNIYSTVFRDATNLASAGQFCADFGGYSSYLSTSYLDSPSTTSSTTYQVYIKVNGATTCYMNSPDGGGNAVTGTITLMEIAG